MAVVNSYCPPNASLATIWANHGLSPCLLYTVTSGLLFCFMGTVGILQCIYYWRYGSRIDDALKPKSILYKLQVLCHFVLSVLPLIWLGLQYWHDDSHLYGYQIVRNGGQVVLWLFAWTLMHKERNCDLPSPPSQGHGLVLLLFWTLNVLERVLPVMSFNSADWWWRMHHPPDKRTLALYCVDASAALAAFLLGLRAAGVASLSHRHSVHYWQFESVGAGGGHDSATAAAGRQRLLSASSNGSGRSTWRNVTRKLRLILPYVWPKKSASLQLRVVLCFFLLIAGRVVNVFVPLLFKEIVNSLTYPSSLVHLLEYRWDLICIWVGMRLLQGGAGMGGMLNILRSFLWIGVQQYTSREVQLELFAHLHALSLRWHIGRKTGEVLRVMDRGTASISSLLQYILFNIVPTLVDIVVAIVYFVTAFNVWFGVILFVTMAAYLAVTVAVTEWRTKFRRNMNRLDNEARAKAVDSLLNFETVKYYNAEDFEAARYRDAIVQYQSAEWISQATLNLLNFLQAIVVSVSVLAGALLCAYMVVHGNDGFTVGDFVLFTTYVMQLYQPLNWLGTYYRMIQQSFIDVENMVDLFNEGIEVADSPAAVEFELKSGQMEFRNVSFSYKPNSAPVLSNINFVVQPGQSIALVGASGGGKSTLMRLLFRFYDVTAGQILFDGQDVRSVKQKSLRQHIGVVPQDTVLFNDTIRYNIAYGHPGASLDDVIEAARAADIHDKILTFPDGYDTVVGERGLKLSGGEKQRVAIARTILKAPAFLLLDEATSALDTATERNIQSSFQSVQRGRTSVTIAHRLSTIVGADEIFVLDQGQIVEHGSHDALLALNGKYAELWNQQVNSASGSGLTPRPSESDLAGKAEQPRGRTPKRDDE